MIISFLSPPAGEIVRLLSMKFQVGYDFTLPSKTGGSVNARPLRRAGRALPNVERCVWPSPKFAREGEGTGAASAFPSLLNSMAALVLWVVLGAASTALANPLNDLQVAIDQQKNLAEIEGMPFASTALTREQSERAGEMLWRYHASRIRREHAAEMQSKKIVIGENAMRFDYTIFGEPPANGRSLYLSMHGGGGTAPAVNDSQWNNQKRLYRLAEGVYVAPRAPTDTWNLWHQAHIDELFDRLIENMIVFENVDPDRVYIMGYSAGGDGVYQLAPRMADRWAAAAMMAGHPNETSALGLRNIGFTLHMGEKDASYDRNKIAGQWKEKLGELRRGDPEGYPHHVEIHRGKGHWMDRQDAVAIEWMAKFTRNVRPERIVWKQDDVRHDRFYWLAIDESETTDRALVIASRDGQRIEIETNDLNEVIIRFDDSMVDMDQPILVRSDGETRFEGRVSRTIRTLAKTLDERGDQRAMFSGEVAVSL